MKNTRIICLILALATLIALVGCNSEIPEETTESVITTEAPVLDATEPEATEPEVKWSSSNDLVAKVIRGKVTAMGEGECTITATVGEFTATCKVTVIKLVYTGIKYDGSVMGNLVNLRQGPDTSYLSHGFLMQDDTLVIYGDPTPNNWYSVLVTSGRCEGLEGYVYGDFVKITKEQVESLVFNTSDSILTVGDTLNLSWTVSPSESTVTFESSDTAIITVSENGVIAAIAEGTAVITAKAGDITASLNITVTESGFTGTKYIGQIATNGGALNMREGPGTDFAAIGKFANGTEITVYGDVQVYISIVEVYDGALQQIFHLHYIYIHIRSEMIQILTVLGETNMTPLVRELELSQGGSILFIKD